MLNSLYSKNGVSLLIESFLVTALSNDFFLVDGHSTLFHQLWTTSLTYEHIPPYSVIFYHNCILHQFNVYIFDYAKSLFQPYLIVYSLVMFPSLIRDFWFCFTYCLDFYILHFSLSLLAPFLDYINIVSITFQYIFCILLLSLSQRLFS